MTAAYTLRVRRLMLAALVAAAPIGASAAPSARPRIASAVTTHREPRAARVAQQPTSVDLAIAAAQRAEQLHRELAAGRVRLTQRYQDELAAIDQLKRQKPSWRRDRALRDQLAASLESAQTLARLAERLKRAEAEVARARAAAVVAIDRVLPTTSGATRADLERRRRAWAPAPPPSRHIVIPDESLDPLADPEELDQQAAALRDSEAELGREIDRLDHQAQRFDRMAAVRKQHDRAGELDRRDDVDPRRVAVRTSATGGGGATADDSAAPPASGGAGGGSGAGGGGSGTGGTGSGGSEGNNDGFEPTPSDRGDLATSLADVVDPSTVDALRRADGSSDPSIRAAAARRARDAVARRLTNLRKQRAAIEGRARELRSDE